MYQWHEYKFSYFSLLSLIDIKPEVIRYEMCSMVSYYSALVMMFAVNITCGQHLFIRSVYPIYVVLFNPDVLIFLLWFSLGTEGAHFIPKMQRKYQIA